MSLAFCSSSCVASASPDGVLSVADVHSGEKLYTLESCHVDIISPVRSIDGTLIVSGKKAGIGSLSSGVARAVFASKLEFRIPRQCAFSALVGWVPASFAHRASVSPHTSFELLAILNKTSLIAQLKQSAETAEKTVALSCPAASFSKLFGVLLVVAEVSRSRLLPVVLCILEQAGIHGEQVSSSPFHGVPPGMHREAARLASFASSPSCKNKKALAAAGYYLSAEVKKPIHCSTGLSDPGLALPPAPPRVNVPLDVTTSSRAKAMELPFAPSGVSIFEGKVVFWGEGGMVQRHSAATARSGVRHRSMPRRVCSLDSASAGRVTASFG